MQPQALEQRAQALSSWVNRHDPPPAPAPRTEKNVDGEQSLMLSLESTSSRMNRLAKQEMHHGSFLTIDAMLEAIDRVRHEEVQALITELLDEERLALTTLGPLDRRNLPSELRH